MLRKRGVAVLPCRTICPLATLVVTTPPRPALSSERIRFPQPPHAAPCPHRLHEANRHRQLYIFRWESAGPAQN